MIDQSDILYKTNYFYREWTWIRRSLAMFILAWATLFIPLGEGLFLVNLLISGLVIFYFIAKPKDDLAVTSTFLIHIRKSAIERFTKIDKYEIANLKSIRCGGIHSDKWELVDIFNGGGNSGGYSNTVEMSFMDGKSKSLDLSIDRKELDHIVKLVYDQKLKNS